MQFGEVLLLLGFHLVLTSIPGVAASLFAARRGLRSIPVLLTIGVAATGVNAMVAFWAYFADPPIGVGYSYISVAALTILIAQALRSGQIESQLLRQLAIPLCLWILGCTFLIMLGFAHGGIDAPLTMSTTRFTHQLPSDADLPRFWTEWFFSRGHDPAPLYGDWLVSDRPPLQMGYMLWQRPFGWDATRGLNYQIVGVVIQQLWVIAVWALLSAARVSRVTRMLTMVTVLVSPVAIVNGFYVWPKMLPAAMVLAAAALVLTPAWTEIRQDWRGAVLVATLLALAMLGHGSSLFAVVALAVLAAWKGVPGKRWLAIGTATGLVWWAPWSAFQKYYAPPGNRLTKWMMAGQVDIDSRGALKTVTDGYSRAGFGGTLQNKVDNFRFMIARREMTDTLDLVFDSLWDGRRAALQVLRATMFFHLLPSLGLLMLVPLFMAVRRVQRRFDSPDWQFALTCYAAFGMGAIVWGLLLFGNEPSRTVLHAGSYAVPVLGMCAGVAGIRAILPRAAVYYVGLNALLMLAIHLPALDPLPNTSYSPVAFLTAGVGLAAFVFLANVDRTDEFDDYTEPSLRTNTAGAKDTSQSSLVT